MTSFHPPHGTAAETSYMSAVMSAGWRWLLGAAVLGFGAAFSASYLMQAVYRAEVIVLPESRAAGDEESRLSGLSGGGIMSALTSELGTPARIEFLETLRSSGMARNFLREEGVTSVICDAHLARCSDAAASGDESAAELREYAALRVFQRRILSVEEDKTKGVVRVAITWADRRLAAKWANDYVALVNRDLQSQAIAEARRRETFLQRSTAGTEDRDLRLAMYSLLESQLRVEMLASSRSDYAFHIVDSAMPPDPRCPVRPLHSVIGLIGSVAAFALTYACLFIVLRTRRARGLVLSTDPV
jgi:hypothetical protein